MNKKRKIYPISPNYVDDGEISTKIRPHHRTYKSLSVEDAKARGNRVARWCRTAGIPNVFRTPKEDMTVEKRRAWCEAQLERIALMEASLTAWEEAHPEKHAQLPWYEAREQYKRDKALGLVKAPEWWELDGLIQSMTKVGHFQPETGKGSMPQRNPHLKKKKA